MIWPCSECGRTGCKNLGTRGYCAEHLSAFYLSLPDHVWLLGGLAVVDGRPRPDHCEACYDVRCAGCGATWVGPPAEPCGWCAESLRLAIEMQAKLTLAPPEVDRDDRLFERMYLSWAERMGRGVKDEFISERDAERAWSRAVQGGGE